MIQITKIASKSDYRKFDYAVKNDGEIVFTTGSRIEADYVAAWIRKQEISA